MKLEGCAGVCVCMCVSVCVCVGFVPVCAHMMRVISKDGSV